MSVSIFNSSIGKKLIMSISGLFLILFLLFHMSMNLVAVFSGEAYDQVCAFLGTNWYALLGTAVLVLGVVVHILYAFILTLQNMKARGSQRYAVQEMPKQVEWASQNMLVLGIIVILGLGLHLTQFWAHMMFAELQGVESLAIGDITATPGEGAKFISFYFSKWYFCLLYLVWFVAIWFHLGHGFWSAIQTIGWNNKVWMERLKCISNIVSSIIFLGFAVVVIVFYIQSLI